MTGKVEPAQYISFPPNTYDEGSYEVSHALGSCTVSTHRIDKSDREVITCPYGELLLDGVTQVDLEDGIEVTDSDIQTFYTWQEDALSVKNALVTLHFPNSAITPTKVVVYCLELRGLEVREPKNIKLYSSTTESIFPDDEIDGIDGNNDIVIRSGETAENDDYKYRRFDLIIQEDRQVALNYLRISLDFEGHHWMFISEVEVYHMVEPRKYLP